MAKEKKQEFVQHITPRDVDFAQWYTDVVTQTDLMDYTPVRGCMALKPYGNRIWELMQPPLGADTNASGCRCERLWVQMRTPLGADADACGPRHDCMRRGVR